VTATTSLSFPGGGGSSSGGSSSGSGLAFTGSDNSSVALRIGAIALVLGVALVLATRSRRNEHSSV
jgi:LPXTG-motif cell wall-anchored protein